MNRHVILAIVAIALMSVTASAVTSILISQLKGPPSSPTGSLAVVVPGTTTPSWGTPGAGLSLSAAGVLSAATGVALPTSVTGEVPVGAVNGVNTVFTLANPPVAGWPVMVYRNGVRMNIANGDYTLSGSTITFGANQIPQTGDTVNSDYWH